MKSIKEKTKAFTLVETLVSIGLFGFISLALADIFVASIRGQTRILQNQQLMEQSSYALEYMGKILRMAQKDTTGTCTGRVNANYGVGTAPEVSISFLAYDTTNEEYRCRQFLFESDAVKEKKSTDETSANFGSAQEITSSKVKVEGLTFAVTGDSAADTIQPRVTVMIKMKTNISINPPDITVQTSVSQRHLDTN